VDIVSKNGNLLLDVGPEADGTIPPIQMDRLRALGAWLHQNGEAIYGTQPWTRATGASTEGVGVRFTRKNGNLYAILLGVPKQPEVTLLGVTPKPGTALHLLGYETPLKWSSEGGNLKIELPPSLPGKYAYVLQLQPAAAE
jgi:alpha-L-fucosidase